MLDIPFAGVGIKGHIPMPGWRDLSALFAAIPYIRRLKFSHAVYGKNSTIKKIKINRSADRVVYPSGAVYEKGIWLLSFGLHDGHCCLQRFSHEELLEKVVPISG